MKAAFGGRLGLQQRVVPQYRTAFFDLLAHSCREGLSVFAGEPRLKESIPTATALHTARLHPARNIHVLEGSLYLCAQAGMREWLEAWDPDALILEANPRYLSNRRAIAWMKRRGRPVLGWGLGAPPHAGPLAGWRRAGRSSFLRRFDALIAYSTVGAEQYHLAGIAPERVFVAPNAVAGPPAPYRERSSREADRLQLLFVGRLQNRKRIDLLLRACSSLEMRPGLTIVGDGPARAALERLAGRLYPEAIFKGDQRGAALDACFEQADLFVLPGTGGLAVQQAMAHGLPVVVAEADGTQRDMVAAENGWLVAPGDLGALQAALQEAISDPERLRRMGAVSHRMVAEKINIEVMVEVFVGALNTVLAEG